MRLIHYAPDKQIETLSMIDTVLEAVGICAGQSEILGNGLVRYILDSNKPCRIVKDHAKFEIHTEDTERWRRIITEVLAQLGYRYHSIRFQAEPLNNYAVTILGIQPLEGVWELVAPKIPRAEAAKLTPV